MDALKVFADLGYVNPGGSAAHPRSHVPAKVRRLFSAGACAAFARCCHPVRACKSDADPLRGHPAGRKSGSTRDGPPCVRGGAPGDEHRSRGPEPRMLRRSRLSRRVFRRGSGLCHPGAKLAEYAERIAVLARANAVLTQFHGIRRQQIEAGRPQPSRIPWPLSAPDRTPSTAARLLPANNTAALAHSPEFRSFEGKHGPEG